MALVLGSGLGRLAAAVAPAGRVAFADVPGLPAAGAPGHAGEFLFGEIEGVRVALQSGRLHMYEGHDPETVALPVRILAALGVETLIVTNAAGALSDCMMPPALMVIADHINLMFRTPLRGPVWNGEDRFPDMAGAYDPMLRRAASDAARRAGIPIHEGVYVGVLGPSFETGAEITMMRRLGGDAVGMSTIPEVLAGRARGLSVLGLSAITNQAAAVGVSADAVLAGAAAAAADLEKVIRGVLRKMP